MFEEEGLLNKMLNILAKDVAVDCHGNLTIDTAKVQNKRKKSAEEREEAQERRAFRVSLSASMNSIALTQAKENERVATETIAKYQVKLILEENEQVRKVYKQFIKQQEEVLVGIRKHIGAMEKNVGAMEKNNKDKPNEDDE